MDKYPTPKELINNFLNAKVTDKSDEELNKIMFDRLEEAYAKNNITKETYEEFKKDFTKIASYTKKED